MNSMQRVWRHQRLSTETKFRLYRVYILSILLYGSECWTLPQEDLRRLEAFHTRSHRQILGLQWFHFVSNDEVLNISGLPHIQEIIDRMRLQLFGHVVRLESNVPAHRALQQAIGVRGNIRPDSRWRRPRGRPRQTWLHHIADGSPFGIRTEWHRAANRGHGESTRRTSAVYVI